MNVELRHQRQKLKELKIPVGAVARIAKCSPPDFSKFCVTPELMSEKKRSAIAQAIEDAIWLQSAVRETFPEALCIAWNRPHAVKNLIAQLKSRVSAERFLVALTKEQEAANVI